MTTSRTTRKVSADGYALLTPAFIKVTQVTCDDDSFYFEVGASRWKLRTDLEGLKDLSEKIQEAIKNAS